MKKLSHILLILCLSGCFFSISQHDTGTDASSSSSIASGKTTFIAGSAETGYVSLDVASGKETKITSLNGYSVLNAFELSTSSKWLLVQKDNDIFSYDISTDAFIPVKLPAPLKSDETLLTKQSFSEPNIFFITIAQVHPQDEFGSMALTAEYQYILDAATGDASDIAAGFSPSDCTLFDSLHHRMFSWKCGEGVGSSLPIAVTDLSTDRTENVLSADDIQADEAMRYPYVLHHGSTFFVMDSPKQPDIFAIDLTQEKPAITRFTVDPTVQEQLVDFYPYSAMDIPETKTFVLGGDDEIILLRYDDAHHIDKMVSLHQGGVYANRMYDLGPNAYYMPVTGSPTLEEIDTNTWQHTRAIPVSVAGDITLLNQ